MKEEIKWIKKKLVLLILLCVAILGFVGGTLAWFRHLQQLNTVALVQIPSQITLSGANRSELQRISLELTPDDEITGEGKVTIRRVFCIESTADFWLEVIRTTNIEGMDIMIYPVKEWNNDQGFETVKGTDGLNTYYYYTPNKEYLAGSYLNLGEDRKIANNTLHTENYIEEDSEGNIKGDIVQKNAEPLYWRTTSKEVFDLDDYSQNGTATNGMAISYRYYVLELSWNTTSQETDLVYLLASH